MPLLEGDHLASPRILYTHHGVYVGDGRVVHYAGLADGLTSAPITVASLEEFCGGKAVRVQRRRQGALPREEVVQRAYDRLGEDKYNPLTNNCEHFATWCVYGRAESHQVKIALEAAAALAEKAARGQLEAKPAWPFPTATTTRPEGPVVRRPVPTSTPIPITPPRVKAPSVLCGGDLGRYGPTLPLGTGGFWGDAVGALWKLARW